MRRRTKPVGAGGAPIEYIGSVTKDIQFFNGWDSSGEAPDILALAETGDLVVVSLFIGSSSNDTMTWNGMPFTDVYRDTTASPAHYIGYRFVEAGDSNPWMSGVTGFGWSNTTAVFSIFRNVVSFVDSARTETTFNAATINVPSVTAAGQLWLAVGSGASSNDEIEAAPPNYTLSGASFRPSGTSTIAQAYRLIDASSQNPGSFDEPQQCAQMTALLVFEGTL